MVADVDVGNGGILRSCASVVKVVAKLVKIIREMSGCQGDGCAFIAY